MTEVMCQNSFSLVKKSKRSNQIKCLCACDQESTKNLHKERRANCTFFPLIIGLSQFSILSIKSSNVPLIY